MPGCLSDADLKLEPCDILLTERNIFVSSTVARNVGIIVEAGSIYTAMAVDALNEERQHPIRRYGARLKTDVAVFRPKNLTDDEKKSVAAMATEGVDRKDERPMTVAHPKGWGVFRRLTNKNDSPTCSSVVADAYKAAVKDFSVAGGAAKPDDIWHFVMENPEKYDKVRDFKPVSMNLSLWGIAGLLLLYVEGAILVGLGLRSEWMAWAPVWLAPLPVVLGISVASGALYYLHCYLHCDPRGWLGRSKAKKEGRGTRDRRWCQTCLVPAVGWKTWILLIVGVVVYEVVAGFVLVSAVNDTSSAVALAGAWLAGIGLAAATAAMRKALTAQFLIVCGLFISSVSTALGLSYAENDSVFVLAGLAVLLGVSMVSLGLVKLGENNQRALAGFGTGISGASVVSIAVLWALNVPLVSFVPSLVLFLLGLVPLSVTVPKLIGGDEAARSRWGVWGVALLGSGLGAVVAMTISSREWRLASAVLVVLIVGLLTVAIVSDAFQLVVILMIGAALAFVLDSRTVSIPEDVFPKADSSEAVVSSQADIQRERLVVLGDSYMSGEGARSFFDGTNTAGEDGECRRAPTAYAYLVAEEMGWSLDFYACSGATTEDVATGDGVEAESRLDTQLGRFIQDRSGDEPKIAAVLVSVGGNDAWFGTVGQSCMGPGSCDIHRDTLLFNLNRAKVIARIELVYRQIREVVGESVPIVAMPYPIILTEKGCSNSPLRRAEHRFLFEFTNALNRNVHHAGKESEIIWFSDGVGAFEGHRICDEGGGSESAAAGANEVDSGDTTGRDDNDGWAQGDGDGELAVNVIDIEPKDGALVDRIMPTNWVHGSAHPNELGHELTARLLISRLESLELALELERLVEALAGRYPQPATESEPSPDDGGLKYPQPYELPGTIRVSTSSLGIPTDMGCPTRNIWDTVAASAGLLGGRLSFSADSGSVVCYYQEDGTWGAVTVEEKPNPDRQIDVELPLWSREAALGFDADQVPPRQVIVYQDDDDAKVVVKEYCELDPDCPDSEEEIRAWALEQVGSTAESGALPTFLLFLGVWFCAIYVRGRRLAEVQEGEVTDVQEATPVI